MEKSLEEFIKLSQEIGKDSSLVQGGGGNTSVKNISENRMYVKASGTALKDVDGDSGYRILDTKKCRGMLSSDILNGLSSEEREDKIAENLEACCVDNMQGRPSVEANLHALLGTCVAHTHPVALNALLCAVGGDEVLEQLYAERNFPYLLLEPVDFGYPLAMQMKRAIHSYEKKHGIMPKVTFLKNHGLFVSGENTEETLAITQQVVGKAEEFVANKLENMEKRRYPSPDKTNKDELIFHIAAQLRKHYKKILKSPVLVAHSMAEEVKTFMNVPNPRKLARTPALVPDQQLYCNGAPLWIDYSDDPEEVCKAVKKAVVGADHGLQTPVCTIVDGVGMFVAGAGKKLLDSAHSTMLATLKILACADQIGAARPLAGETLQYIKNSNWEKYRHNLFTSGGQDSDLAGKIAVVTGAGSGLGRGIAINLAAKGMHVVLGDIDKDGLHETARRIGETQENETGTTTPVVADVTDEEQVKALYARAIKELGGVDLLVNCASIAPPLSLLEFSADAFRKALDINLTGYMLMAREAAITMKRQGDGGNIINLSSKSGLEASKNHSAYNATKAGEIHMGRGWALELADLDIRVNNVCAGNVFHESKIWNEDYIKALAEKRNLEPDEVIPYYINMTALKKDIKWDDIAHAICFLASSNAAKITGQTLVVDSGQVFVR